MDISKFLKIKNDTSGPLKVDLTDVKKLLVQASFVGGSAAVAYLLSNVGSLNLGENTVWIVPAVTILLNFMYKWLKDNRPVEDKEEKKE